MYLNELKINEEAKILEINCKENIKRRLLDLGMIKGTKIKEILKSPTGDPKAFNIRGTLIALREEDLKQIKIERI